MWKKWLKCLNLSSYHTALLGTDFFSSRNKGVSISKLNATTKKSSPEYIKDAFGYLE